MITTPAAEKVNSKISFALSINESQDPFPLPTDADV